MRGVQVLFLIGFLVSARESLGSTQTMSRDEIIDLARSAVGYSYWWGGGCWRTDGCQHGSCSGSCPNCTHTGSYGADCSGLAAKVWQVPSPSPVTTNSHPYSTYHFRYSFTHWSQIQRESAQRGDCLVYRNSANTGGHIVVYESGDPWGSMWLYEARGCSYGIVHNLRSLSSSYIAIRRDALASGPASGKLQGVVFVDRGQGTADMSERIPGAVVSAGGQSASTRADDAYWSFDLAPGDYDLHASATGYSAASRSCAVSAGGETWCSIGLAPVCVPDCSGRSCGPDGCGGSCGSCAAGHACEAGQCRCVPDCTGLACGPDPICGSSCGDCPAAWACGEGGVCACVPECGGRQCGPDPACGMPCGECGPGLVCQSSGLCSPVSCEPDCAGRQCGPDPRCGASCGGCAEGQTCNPQGECVAFDCVPDCSSRECGLDPRCGAICGHCDPDRFCDLDGSCQPIDPDRAKLYGWVVELAEPAERGRRIGGACVCAQGQGIVQTDVSGYFELLVLPGEHVLSAAAQGYLPGSLECSGAAGTGAECSVSLEPLLRRAAGSDEQELVIQGGCSAAGGQGLDLLAALGLWLLLVHRRRRRAA
ncbi:MAG: carboxypeptidase regulatory-like domain-containing protein [Deltaproteobacteria bacterium]|nr:carboxypeptidase regulatory-like domain-containing protein [Deltaproteobacteria bacterium]